jgi:hypothetical protein
MANTIIKFTKESFLKQNPDLSADNQGPDNVVKQGAGSRYEVSDFGIVDPENGHRKIKIPVQPFGKETWFVFDKHVSKVDPNE